MGDTELPPKITTRHLIVSCISSCRGKGFSLSFLIGRNGGCLFGGSTASTLMTTTRSIMHFIDCEVGRDDGVDSHNEVMLGLTIGSPT